MPLMEVAVVSAEKDQDSRYSQHKVSRYKTTLKQMLKEVEKK